MVANTGPRVGYVDISDSDIGRKMKGKMNRGQEDILVVLRCSHTF
jgi:hypothetical protein